MRVSWGSWKNFFWTVMKNTIMENFFWTVMEKKNRSVMENFFRPVMENIFGRYEHVFGHHITISFESNEKNLPDVTKKF